ncbi:MAG TPA: tRNA pseudouridine synthase A [Chloroflexota bacterium]|nr:tRNA pseudouridine synthase A [Chloroflexota bacterium]
MRLLATVEYDGTDFAGFQLQAHRGRRPRTVQAELERAVAPLAGYPHFLQRPVSPDRTESRQGPEGPGGTEGPGGPQQGEAGDTSGATGPGTAPRIVGAGRTDAGVHAAGQVVHLDTEAPLAADLPRFLQAWNARLPRDVAVLALRHVPPEIHARYSARSRTYAYRILSGGQRSPLLRRYTHHLRQPLDLASMRAAAAHLLGVHDFAPFGAQEGPGSTVREVLRATVIQHRVQDGAGQWANPLAIWHTLSQTVAQSPGWLHGPAHPGPASPAGVGPEPGTSALPAPSLVTIEIEANAFLRHMMRRIVGTLVEIGLGRRPADDVASILATGAKARVGQAAPACGLCLQCVRYNLDG